MAKELYTTREAAKLAGLTADIIRAAIRRGDLKANTFGNSYVITRDNLADYLERRKAGRRGKV